MGNVKKIINEWFLMDQNTLKFHEHFTKNYDKESHVEYFLEVYANIF